MKKVVLIVTLMLMLSSANAEMMYVLVNEGSYLNARAAPRKSAPIEAQLERGWEVEVLEIKDGWAKATGYGESAVIYVAVECLSNTLLPEPTEYVVIGGGRLRLREKPFGKAVDWLRPGDTVIVNGGLVEDGIEWAQTKGGYVMAEYLQKI